jgi:hypothetical protein
MKRSKPLAVTLLLLAWSLGHGRAQSLLSSGPPAAPAATLHFYQPKAFGLFYPKVRVYADGRLLCKLGRNSHCQVRVPAGTTAFTATTPGLTWGTPPALTLTLEPGQQYYLQGDHAPAGIKVPGLSYGFTQVVPNEAKLAQLAQAKAVQPLAPLAH